MGDKISAITKQLVLIRLRYAYICNTFMIAFEVISEKTHRERTYEN